MNSIDDLFTDVVSQFMQHLAPTAVQRVAALAAARGVMPDADVEDRIRLAHFVLTGSGEFPDQEEIQKLEVRTMSSEAIPLRPKAYPYDSGDALVLGPEIFANTKMGPAENTVICWQGVNFVPQHNQPEDSKTDEDEDEDEEAPDFGAEPAPIAGAHWRGRRG